MSSDEATKDVLEVNEEKTKQAQNVKYQSTMKTNIGDGQAEAQFQMFMDPMFAELEARVKEHEKILDKMNEQMLAEKEARRKAKEQAHLPQPLRGSGREIKTLLQKVEDMILYEIEDDVEKEEEKEETPGMNFMELFKKPGEEEEGEEKKKEEVKVKDPSKRVQIQKLDDHGRAAVTAHSLAAYVSCLNDDHLHSFTSKITADCQLWLGKMFRFGECGAFYHDEVKEGLIRVCRLALHQKYPKYVTEGFEALYSRPPVIYLSAATPPGLPHYICLQLGLPLSTICVVPCNSSFGSITKIARNQHERMDTDILKKLIEDDIAAAKTPVAMVAYAGTPSVGHVDEIESIQEICKKHSIWLHVEGHNLATLCLMQVPSSVSTAKYADSITLSIGTWLGIPALPHATLYKISDPTLVHASSLNTFNPQLKLSCLPLWVVLQSLGIESIEGRIKESCELATKMFEEIARFKTVRQISKTVNKDDDRPIRSVSELIHKAIDALLFFEMVTPTVVFKYTEEDSQTNTVVAPYAVGTGLDQCDEDDTEIEQRRKHEYYNALNAWLLDTLQTENPNIKLSGVEVDKEGLCIRFSPLESAQVLGTTDDDVENFGKCLKAQLEILDATVLNYEKFRLVCGSHPNLRIVEVSSWAGLGAVQYIPDEYLDCLDNLTPLAEREINSLNTELVHQLKTSDSAFSLGYTDSDMACVKFGLITEDTDLEELISMVQSAGKEVEESSKYNECMAELIQKGIEEANKDLELENQNKLVQEGVLRQIPMLGSVMNWWSPPPKNLVKGRTFNLTSGTIASTEETYKYKMQIQSESPRVSPRQRTNSGSSVTSRSSVTSKTSSKAGMSLPLKIQQLPPSPPTPTPSASTTPTPQSTAAALKTETAGEVKARLQSMVNDSDLTEGHDSLPSPNGNLSLNLDAQEP